MTKDETLAALPPGLREYLERCRGTEVDDLELAAEIESLDFEGLPAPSPNENGEMPRQVLRAYRRLIDSGHKRLADAYMGRYTEAEQQQRGRAR